MKPLQRALVALGIFAVLAIGLLFWSVQYNRAKAAKMEEQILTKLSAEDIAMILEGEGNPQQLAPLVSNPKARKDLLEQLKELLALAAEARRSGIADDPLVRNQLEISNKFLLAQNYDAFRNDGQPAPPLGSVTAEEITAFWAKPESEISVKKFVDTVQTLQNNAAKERGTKAPKLEGKALEQARDRWARVSILDEKARADSAFIGKREVQLQIKLQEAQLLATEYATKRLAKQIDPTPAEVKKYMAESDKFDPVKLRAKAESVLARAKAGEDFAALAAEYSDDPGSKDNGGLYEDIGKGQFVPQFEQAALALEPGGIAPNLIESDYGFHIIKLESKRIEKGKDGKDEVKFNPRHILFKTKFEEEGNGSPMSRPRQLTPEEAAKAELIKKNQKKLIEGIVERNHIELPEDFTVKLPEGADADPTGLPTAPEGLEIPKPSPSPKAKPSATPKKK